MPAANSGASRPVCVAAPARLRMTVAIGDEMLSETTAFDAPGPPVFARSAIFRRLGP